VLKIVLDILLKVWTWVRQHPSLSIRIMEDNPSHAPGNLRFEIENRSDTETSLVPLIQSTYWYPKQGKYFKGRALYDVRDLDRHLPPFKPRIMSATARELPDGYLFSWFRKYTFRPTRGHKATICVRNVLLEPLGCFRCIFEETKFRITRKGKQYKSISVDQYDQLKRSQGPH